MEYMLECQMFYFTQQNLTVREKNVHNFVSVFV